MIRHIVTWTLKSDDQEEKAAQTADIAARLSPLVDLVEGFDWLEIHSDMGGIDGNSDVLLVSQFASRDALNAYLDHPEHLAAVEVIREYFAGRAAIDYEVAH